MYGYCNKCDERPWECTCSRAKNPTYNTNETLYSPAERLHGAQSYEEADEA